MDEILDIKITHLLSIENGVIFLNPLPEKKWAMREYLLDENLMTIIYSASNAIESTWFDPPPFILELFPRGCDWLDF